MSILAAMMGVMSESGGQDNTPDAIDWANTSGLGFASTSSETVTGIYNTIDVWWDYNVASGSGTPNFLVNINGGGYTVFSSGSTNAVTVANNQTLQFGGTSSGVGAWSRTITIYNASDNNAVIDTFTMTVNT